ncbi:MAG: tetratricopeptide repeat protein, partial [Flavobacteriaceae bacterium]
MRKRILPVFFVLATSWAWAQNTEYLGNPDVSFLKARDMAFTGNREGARDTLLQILTKYPNYADVRNLLGKTYSWDGMYDKARSEFNKVTSREPKNREAWMAAINNERYAGNHSIAMGLANKALSRVPNDLELMALRNKV